ncbi:hypothetical protein BJ875DRAFT_341900, partial [Amylocarpus encephaloides]
SMKVHFAKAKIKELERGLIKIRDAICTRLLVLLSEQQAELSAGLYDLAQLTGGMIVDNQRALEKGVKKLSLAIEAKRWTSGDDDAFLCFATDLKKFIKETQNSKRTTRILKSLHFKQLKERQSEVREAHKNTFEWIFDVTSGINFALWLEGENGIYWIAGKPGSGKSTLMKFLLNDKRTIRLLQRWSGQRELVLGNHFFWSAGTTLQKSQTGLFRTLLFQIFLQCPKIAAEVCPGRWSSDSHSWIEAWDWEELLCAFKNIACLENLPTKICLFIDGLDEYDGDHVQLIEVLRDMAKSPNIKICASSRPWWDFIDAFGGQQWKLKVQDLTVGGILLYVKDNLEQNPHFQRLRQRDGFAATELVEEIQSKSYGVFLWVYLVVRSLSRGLRNFDKIADLRRRVYELPGELEDYFKLMLDSIEKIYQQTTARIFKVMIAARGTLPVVAFQFLD